MYGERLQNKLFNAMMTNDALLPFRIDETEVRVTMANPLIKIVQIWSILFSYFDTFFL